jgi:hypothetical protein
LANAKRAFLRAGQLTLTPEPMLCVLEA